MNAESARPLCDHCGLPVAPGDGKEAFVPQGGARGGADVIVHRDPAACGPVAPVRRYSPHWRS